MNKNEINKLAKNANFAFWQEDEWWGSPGEIDWSCDYSKEFEKFVELLLNDILHIAGPAGDERSQMYSTRKEICDAIKEKYFVSNDDILLAADHMSDKGYEIGTQEGYEEFVRKRNEKN